MMLIFWPICLADFLYLIKDSLSKWLLLGTNANSSSNRSRLIYSNSLMHGSKLKYLLKTIPKHAFCLCLLIDTSVSHRLANANVFTASRRLCWRGRYSGFSGNCCNQISTVLTNTTLACITGNITFRWHQSFSEDGQVHSYKNTRTTF